MKRNYLELEPELEACVETKAKRRYNEITRELLQKGEDKELLEKLETLRLFIESADFSKLRSESEKHLISGRKVKFTVYLEKGQAKHELKVTE